MGFPCSLLDLGVNLTPSFRQTHVYQDGISQTSYFHAEFPTQVHLQFAEIHHLEALAILVALRLWSHLWAGLRIRVYCDNQAVVSALASGKVKDQLLGCCLRDIWYHAALHEFELRAVHLPGKDNRAADLLSRWHLNSAFRDDFRKLPTIASLTPMSVPQQLFNISTY
jgi:hypothetical protein